MPYTYEELSEKIEKLPEDVKEAIFGVETSQTLQEIGKKHTLHVDKLGELVNEVGLVMVGITHPKDFIPNLVKRLQVDQLTARNIAEDINKQIFQKVRESLKKIHGLAEEEAGIKNQELRIKEEIKSAPPALPKPGLKPLEIHPVRAKSPEATAPPLAGISNGVRPSAEPQKSAETKPTQPLNYLTTQPPPGLAFEEKTKESIFRTPSETREKIEEKPTDTIKEKSFADIKKEMGNAKIDPYREAIE